MPLSTNRAIFGDRRPDRRARVLVVLLQQSKNLVRAVGTASFVCGCSITAARAPRGMPSQWEHVAGASIKFSARDDAGVAMKQISVRWGDLGSPVQPGNYRCGPHMVEVTPGDIKLAEGNPDAVFTAIHPDFYPADYPYLLTGVELPTKSWSPRGYCAERLTFIF
jgi:hypothetical protein